MFILQSFTERDVTLSYDLLQTLSFQVSSTPGGTGTGVSLLFLQQLLQTYSISNHLITIHRQRVIPIPREAETLSYPLESWNLSSDPPL